VLAEFASVLDAARCAIEIQAALQRANEDEPEGRGMRFRIGVNVGDVMVKDGDIFGDGVNVAARLELALWDSVNDGSPGELESYIEHYPEVPCASLARTRLDAAALSPTSPPVPTSGELAAEALDVASGIS
jgi:hypothetical protein